MKKTLSVLLAVVMLFSCMSLMVFAEDAVIEVNDGNVSDTLTNYATLSGNNYVVRAGDTLSIPAGSNLLVASGSTLLIENGASLVISGTAAVQESASLKVAGRVTNAHKIAVDTQGEAVAEVRFPSLSDFALSDKVYIKYAFGYTGGATDDLTGLEWHTVPQTSALSVWAPLNQYFYINAHIIEPAEISQYQRPVRLGSPEPVFLYQRAHHRARRDQPVRQDRQVRRFQVQRLDQRRGNALYAGSAFH